MEEKSILTEDLSIGDLFELGTGAEVASDVKAGLGAEDLSALRKAVPKMISWSSVQEGVADSLVQALHVSVLGTLANGWKHYSMFMEDVRRSRSNPGVEILSAIAEHSIHSTLHPFVDVRLAGKTVHEIAFEVSLETKMKGLQLGLRKGEIVSVEVGECEWTGKITVAEVDVLERKLKTLRVPGHLRLKRGITIPID
jgi:hypothetical protein